MESSTFCKSVDINPDLSVGAEETERSRQSKIIRGAEKKNILDFYTSNNGRKNQLRNGACVTEDVNPETEMFAFSVLNKDIMLVL